MIASRRFHFSAVLATLFALALLPVSATAQVPHDMAYQGVLTDEGGAPLTGPVDLVLRVYDMMAGGVPLYTETHSGVTIDEIDGSFLVQLGFGTTDLDTDGDGAAEANTFSFDSSLFVNGPNRYLEVQVGSGASGEILAPRQIIGSVPYALVAEDVVTDPATSQVGALIETAQVTADAAEAAAVAAQSTADATVGIASAQINSAGVLELTLSNGTVLNAGNIEKKSRFCSTAKGTGFREIF